MKDYYSLQDIDTIAEFIRGKISSRPQIGMILGSGLGGLADSVENATRIPFAEIPGWPLSTVSGHQGQMVVGRLENQDVLVLQGRVHYYEGYNMATVTLPVRVLQRLGVQTLIVTNAAGAVNPDFEPGNLMLITDQVNLIAMAGQNPLRGPNLDELGVRFPDMSQAYNRELLELAREAAKENRVILREGVYVCLAGPSYETPADLRFLKLAGADAVGMSTAPEVIVAHHGGTRVLGISGISNKANLDGNTITTHEEVLAAGRIIVPQLTTLVRAILRRLPNQSAL